MTVTNPYPVDSATRTCCGGIGRHTRACTSVPLPAGAVPIDPGWETGYGDPYRVVQGVDRRVTDHAVTVCTTAVQARDGGIENPTILVYELDDSQPLNSDQARELAAALLQAAAEIDGWAAE